MLLDSQFRRRSCGLTGRLRLDRRSRGLSIRFVEKQSGVGRKRISLAERGLLRLKEHEEAAISAVLSLAGSRVSAPRHRRLVAGLFLQEVAARATAALHAAGLPGVSETVLSLYERGLTRLDPRTEQAVLAAISGQAEVPLESSGGPGGHRTVEDWATPPDARGRT